MIPRGANWDSCGKLNFERADFDETPHDTRR